MNVRSLRAKDAPDLVRFLREYFPEEEAILGTRPEGFQKVVRRIFRWDARLVLGFLRLIGRPVFRFFVVEDQGRVVATTLLTFSRATGYISMVSVDRAYRRHGLARTLLGQAREASRRRRKRCVALDVLEANAPARALYEHLGYQRLRATAYYVHDHPDALRAAPPAVAGLRRFDRRDAGPLAAIAQRGRPRELNEVLPTTERELVGSPWEGQVLASELASWVIDRGSGAVAWAAAAVSEATEAGHLSSPIVDPGVPAEAAEGLVRTAGTWCAERQVPRLIAVVSEENVRGREALEAAGFRHAIPVLTLYRPVD